MLRVIAFLPKFRVSYSRKYLEDLAIDHEAIKKQQLAVQQAARKQTVQDFPFNQKNAKNHIKIKLNHPLLSINPLKPQQKQVCEIYEPKVPVINPLRTISAHRRFILTSIKKATIAMYPVKKLYVLDAINVLEHSEKKVAKVMAKTFYNLLDHAKHKGYNPTRLFVHGCIIGKTRRYRGVRYHAKGRGCKEKRDYCQIKVILYEKSEKQFFQDVGKGKCPPGYANVIRYSLSQMDANYQAISQLTGVTTSRGRQQARELLKRRVDVKMKQNETNGVFVAKKKIMDQLVEKSGIAMKQKIQKLFQPETGVSQSIKLREKTYKKNMKID